MFFNRLKQATALALCLSLVTPSGLFAQNTGKSRADVKQTLQKAALVEDFSSPEAIILYLVTAGLITGNILNGRVNRLQAKEILRLEDLLEQSNTTIKSREKQSADLLNVIKEDEAMEKALKSRLSKADKGGVKNTSIVDDLDKAIQANEAAGNKLLANARQELAVSESLRKDLTMELQAAEGITSELRQELKTNKAASEKVIAELKHKLAVKETATANLRQQLKYNDKIIENLRKQVMAASSEAVTHNTPHGRMTIRTSYPQIVAELREEVQTQKATITNLRSEVTAANSEIRAATSKELNAVSNQIIEDLIAEGKAQRGSSARIIAAQDDATRTILKLNTQMERVEAAAAGAQADDAIKAAFKTIEQLKAIKVPNATTEKMVKDFINSATRRLKGKGGAAGAVLVMVGGTAAMLMTSADANAQVVSNNRIAVEKALADSYKNNPELFTANAVALTRNYGDNLVSSIIYENQATYLPVLETQVKVAKIPEVIQYVKNLNEKQTTVNFANDMLNWQKTPKANTENIKVPFRPLD